MTGRTLSRLFSVLIVLVITLSIAVAAWLRWDVHRMSSQVKAIDEYCERVLEAVRDDRYNLASTDPRIRDLGFAMIGYAGKTYHGQASIEMCVDPRALPLPFPKDCVEIENPPCLSGYARDVEQAMLARD